MISTPPVEGLQDVSPQGRVRLEHRDRLIRPGAELVLDGVVPQIGLPDLWSGSARMWGVLARPVQHQPVDRGRQSTSYPIPARTVRMTPPAAVREDAPFAQFSDPTRIIT